MASPHSSDAIDEAQDALRKINRDLATFRDPDVRREFYSLSENPSDDLDTAESPARLKAIVMSLRTKLHESNESQKRIESGLFDSSRRAAKAQAEVEELKKQLKDKEVEHDTIVKTASERIETLEKESKEAVESARTKAYRLQESLDKDRLGSRGLAIERDRYRSEAKSALSRVRALEREVKATNDRMTTEMMIMAKEKDAAEKKNVALIDEVKHLQNTLRSRSRLSEGSNEKDDYIEKLRNEAAVLRNDIAGRESTVISMKAKMIDMQSTFFELNRDVEDANRKLMELPSLKRELEVLRSHRKEYGNVSTHVSALVREKEQLTQMISKLSVNGDVQEGLRILEDASASQHGGKHRLASDSEGTGLRRELQQLRTSHDAEKSDQQNTLQNLRRKLEDQTSHIEQLKTDRDQALAHHKRSTKLRRILQHEKTFFKAALEKIEAEFDTVNEPSREVAQLRERCDAFERSSMEYESVVKDLERTVEELRSQIEKLTAALFDAKNSEVLTEASSREQNDLVMRLEQAETAANKANEARNTALENLRESSARLHTMKEEMRKLKSSVTGPAHPEVLHEEMDHDHTTSKVVHMKENPLSQAMAQAAAEREGSKGIKRMRLDSEDLSGRDETANETIVTLQKNIKELQTENAELTTSSKVGIRTGELARKKIEEVRGAVYNLFGWSMKILGAKYTISSIYADAAGDDLEFGMNEAGTMSMMETEYTHRLTEEIDQYVQKMSSIPALLAHITMENFEKTTAFV